MFRELEEISAEKIEFARPRLALGRYIHKDWQTFLRIYAIDEITGDLEEQLARALAFAVHQIALVIRDPQRVGIVFGRFPYFAVDVEVGAELYVANMERERALACADDKRIYVDAFRIFGDRQGSERRPSTIILEELVHAWMLIRHENLAEAVVNRLDSPGFRKSAQKLTDEGMAAFER